jgi:uncharacterized membrane protein
MAGIGFELKKLFKGKGFLSSIKAYLYSALVSVGPFVLCVIMIVSIQLFLNFMDVPLKEKELFIATVVYTFIFAQIITSGFTMIITRFISDMLYSKKLGYIQPSLYGIISIVTPIASIPAIIFLWKSPLPIEIKLVSYLFFMELIIVYLIMVYLTALKDYMRIVKSFIWGVLIALTLAFIFIKYTGLNKVFTMLLSMDIGFLIIISLLITYLKKFFGASEEKSSNKYYSFIAYFDKYISLFLISFLYTMALYSHNFIFWSSNLGVKIASTYVFAPTYDVPTFYAFLSIIPSMVVFVISVETSFYEKYRNYYSLITGKGSFTEIDDAQKSMTRVLWAEIRNLMEIQILFSIIFIVAAFYLFPRMGLTRFSFDIFMLLILGAYCDIILLIIILILLYFEDRKGALVISIIFLITSVLFTSGTLILGETTYGLGLFLSTFFTLIAGFIRLRIYLDNIHYHTFLGQPVIYREIKGVFGRLVDTIYKSR